jgi:hypothetical protein
VVHDAKQISTLKLANMYFSLLHLPNNIQLNIQSQRWVKKVQIKCVIFELISRLLSSLNLCNQQFLLLRETLILSLQKKSYFEHLIIQVQKSLKQF